MTNAMTTTGGGFLAASMDAYAALEAVASEMGGSGGVYLKFNGNDGIFTYGSTGDELELGSQVAFNPTSLERGWICWKDEEVVGETMVPYLTGRRVSKSDLPDNGPYESTQDGWQEQMIVHFKMTEAPYTDLIFKATGISKMNAVKRLIQDFTKSYKQNPNLVPIVEIDEVSFESKAKGARGAKKHAPVFKITAWVPESDLVAAEDGDASEYEAEEPVKALPAPKAETKKVTKPAPAPEPEVEAEPEAEAETAAPAATARQTAARRGRF